MGSHSLSRSAVSVSSKRAPKLAKLNDEIVCDAYLSRINEQFEYRSQRFLSKKNRRKNWLNEFSLDASIIYLSRHI